MLPLRCPRGWAQPHKHPPTRFTELAERILLFAGIICKSGRLYVELYNKSLLLLNWPSDAQRQSYRAFFMFWMIYPCFTCPPLLCESRDLDTAVLFPVLFSKQPKPNNFRLYFSLHPLCFCQHMVENHCLWTGLLIPCLRKRGRDSHLISSDTNPEGKVEAGLATVIISASVIPISMNMGCHHHVSC